MNDRTFGLKISSRLRGILLEHFPPAAGGRDFSTRVAELPEKGGRLRVSGADLRVIESKLGTIMETSSDRSTNGIRKSANSALSQVRMLLSFAQPI